MKINNQGIIFVYLMIEDVRDTSYFLKFKDNHCNINRGLL